MRARWTASRSLILPVAVSVVADFRVLMNEALRVCRCDGSCTRYICSRFVLAQGGRMERVFTSIIWLG
jgi:hypothetical protein